MFCLTRPDSYREQKGSYDLSQGEVNRKPCLTGRQARGRAIGELFKLKITVLLRNNRLKIKAFTLSEMIVVLLITVIVVGLAFSVLRLVQKQMGGIEKNYQNTTEANRLQQALWIDFATYPHIFYNDLTQTLRCENELGYQEYFFQEDKIIREKDTFHLKLQRKTFFLDGLEHISGQLDALEMETTPEQGAKIIFIHQGNASNEYMNSP